MSVSSEPILFYAAREKGMPAVEGLVDVDRASHYIAVVRALGAARVLTKDLPSYHPAVSYLLAQFGSDDNERVAREYLVEQWDYAVNARNAAERVPPLLDVEVSLV